MASTRSLSSDVIISIRFFMALVAVIIRSHYLRLWPVNSHRLNLNGYGRFHKIVPYRVAMNRKRLDYRFRIFLCVHCLLNDRAEIGQHTNGTAQGNPWGEQRQ